MSQELDRGTGGVQSASDQSVHAGSGRCSDRSDLGTSLRVERGAQRRSSGRFGLFDLTETIIESQKWHGPWMTIFQIPTGSDCFRECSCCGFRHFGHQSKEMR